MESMAKKYPKNLHPALRDSFVPLPSDPNVRLTQEQLDALFPPENRHVWQEVVSMVMKKHNIELREEDNDEQRKQAGG
jgi:hypothetical protein